MFGPLSFFLCYLQVEREDALVLLVGGGSVLMDQNMSLSGASRVITPAKYSVSVCQTQYVAVMEFKPSASQLDMGGHGSAEQTAFCDTNTCTYTHLNLGCCKCRWCGAGHGRWQL